MVARPPAPPTFRRVKTLACIVPAYNEASELPRTLEALGDALGSLAPIETELIVVDNNSSDETAAVAQAHGARVVFEGHNQIARARNTGARATAADALLFVDADTRVAPALVQAAAARLRSGQVAGGGASIAFEGPVPPLARQCVASWNWLARQLSLAAGSFVYIRRDAFEAIGGFSEKVYAGEEIHLSRALKRWARRHGMRMEILAAPPVRTSSRKFTWHGAWRVAALHTLLAVFPFLLSSRRVCAFWYARPQPRSQKPAPAE